MDRDTDLRDTDEIDSCVHCGRPFTRGVAVGCRKVRRDSDVCEAPTEVDRLTRERDTALLALRNVRALVRRMLKRSSDSNLDHLLRFTEEGGVRDSILRENGGES